jgi:phosphopantothenoylcysteine decarboxylase/phosphopantothenate--cysteine ligase
LKSFILIKILNNKEDYYAPMHPSQDLLGQKGDYLTGKKIVLGITGSIAAVETVKLIHELIRYGAIVFPVMTKAGTEIINPEAVKYASGIQPITKLTGDVEHVSLCGETKDKADLLLIAPCTANTISKIAVGIDDTTVTTFATTAIGSKTPIIIVPAMHGSMYEHQIIQDNIKKLKSGNLNIEFIEPIRSEAKYKMPTIKEITSKVIRKLWKCDLAGKSVLVIAGATAETVDDMRVLTNRSTGGTGLALANQAFLRGAEVKLWLGKADEVPESYLNCQRFQTFAELEKLVEKISNSGKYSFDIIINCAAISDYTSKVKHKGKLSSGKAELKLNLVPTKKIIPEIKKRAANSFIVGFKAESKIKEPELIDKAIQRMKEWKIDMMVGNDLERVKATDSEVIIIRSRKKYKKVKGEKEYIAQRIFDEILK